MDRSGRAQEQDRNVRADARDRNDRIQHRPKHSAEDLRRDLYNLQDKPVKRYREALELPAPQEDDGLRPFSSRGVCADPLPCRLCPGLAFRSEAILVTHINEEHGGVEKYRQLFLCEEACQGHEVMGEEWRMILANFAAFQTQSATSWDDLNDMVKGTPHVRCRGGCCICARTAWSEDHRWAPLLGPQCPFQNCHK